MKNSMRLNRSVRNFAIPIHSQRRWSRNVVASVSMLLIVIACGDVTPPLPPGTINPKVVETAEGAAGMFQTARLQFQRVYILHLLSSGIFTDELKAVEGVSLSGVINGLDARMQGATATPLPENNDLYVEWHKVRASSAQAIGALKAYDSERSEKRRGLLYALQGYAELFLADFYCSGIPLSTFDFGKDFTYRPGSKTDEVYRHAIALFDTAFILAHDSIPVANLARVGIGRALIALGEYDKAAVAIQDVPPDFQFAENVKTCRMDEEVCVPPNTVGSSSLGQAQFTLASLGRVCNLICSSRAYTMSDREGENGLPYISTDDPRTEAVSSIEGGTIVWYPAKYPEGEVNAFVVASGVEAKLIQAEAQLQPATNPKGAWRQTLNALRANAGLDTLGDPGSDTGRVNLLFRERAAWLFLTGHRQGDLRRLVRRYGRPQQTVYPSGIYTSRTSYGTAVDLVIPESEWANPLYRGCNRD